MNVLSPKWQMMVLLIGLVGLVGCGPRSSQVSGPIRLPDATVDRVQLVDVSEGAATYEVQLTLENRNREALPMMLATYTLTIDGESYQTDTVPNATLPSERGLTVWLPAVVEHEAEVGVPYEVRGWMRLDPQGQVKRFFYDLGWPRPRTMFFRQGTVEAAAD